MVSCSVTAPTRSRGAAMSPGVSLPTWATAIFVAAYLIMVFPLTAMRVVEIVRSAAQRPRPSVAQFHPRHRLRVYPGAAAIAIYFSGSRGPWLGLGASLVLILLGLSLIWRKRWMTISGVVAGAGRRDFPGAAQHPQRSAGKSAQPPGFRPLSELLDAESRTGRVRTLIWQGASELVPPHAPLEFPDGRDGHIQHPAPVDRLRPGEHVRGLQPLLPAELTRVEKRNASPTARTTKPGIRW